MVQPAIKKGSKGSDNDLGIGPIKKFGRYTLIKKLATGGMAEIWLARQSGLAGFNRFVVIKKILSHLAEEDTFVKMFLDEARMSVQLTHPNIVQVYDLGDAEGTYFIAMEYIAGENLAAIAWRGVKRKKPLSPQFAARILADACKALHYAHHLSGPDGVPLELVHRDISPQNILVTYEGEVKVVDFGIAKAATKSQHTKTGMLKGKFSYMSPEQCLGNPLDMRSDIFALGIVLYELCTGKRLFKHESELMILEMITKRRITPPSQVASDVSPALEAIILKALEKDANDRYQTAQDFAIALEDFLRGETAKGGSAEVAHYMRRLFKDKIEEKQKVCELAASDDFLASFEDEEPTEQALPAARRRVVYGGNGSISAAHPAAGTPGMHDPRMSGYRPGMPMTQTGPHGMMPYSQAGYPPGTMPFQGQSGASIGIQPIPEDRNLAPKIVLAIALVVIGLAGAFLYQLVMNPEQDQYAQKADTKPVDTRTGKIQIDSMPQGALVLVNGEEIKLPSGQDAYTPIEALTELRYGVEYNIRLRKAGHKDFITTVTMGDKENGKKISAKLEPIMAKISIGVSGEQASQVSVLINDRKVGMGSMTIDHEPGRLRISGLLKDHYCKADPEVVTPKPGDKAITTIRCNKSKRSGSSARAPVASNDSTRRTQRRSGRDTPRKSPPTGQRSGPSGCQTLDGLFGTVTINSIPYSVVYVGSKKIGETPLPKVKLPAGCHIVRAVFPGNGNQEKKVKITVEPNKTSRYQIKL